MHLNRTSTPRYALGTIALALGLLAACASPPPGGEGPQAGESRPLEASLEAHPASGPAPLAVVFVPGAHGPDGAALACTLDFGDGAAAPVVCNADARHTYARPGRYTAKLTASDERGRAAEARAAVRVGEAPADNRPPAASLSAQPANGEAPLDVTFTLETADPDGDPLSCTLDFGDGSSASACSGSQNHTYTAPGNYTATLTVDDGRGGQASATAVLRVDEPAASPQFAIELLFTQQPDPEVRAAFENAAARWERVITGDLRDVEANVPAGSCLEDNPGFQGTVDDLLIVADVAYIDGEGNVLGSAGPCYVRGGSGQPDYFLPYFGVMRFDSADLDRMKRNGTLEAVILHEMGHVLGIGTLWEAGPFDFLNHEAASCQDSNEVTYDGARALDAYHALGAVGEVPVENGGGAGTKCGHWREATFDTELMTGWLDGASAPLSRVTVGALDDLGYRVDYGQADAYVLPSGQAGALGAGERLEEVLIFPEPPGP